MLKHLLGSLYLFIHIDLWRFVCYNYIMTKNNNEPPVDKNSWETQPELFNTLNEEFNFTLDAAASHINHKCDAYFTKEENSLDKNWSNYSDTIWVNPPYSRDLIVPFMKKVVEESLKGSTIVTLTRFDPSAKKWFQQYVHNKADEVRMLMRRPKFVGSDSAYPFPCCVSIYNPYNSTYQVPRMVTKYVMWDWDEACQ